MDNLVEENSYSFIQNEKVALNKQGKNAVSTFYFWMQNNMIYNERLFRKKLEFRKLPFYNGIYQFFLEYSKKKWNIPKKKMNYSNFFWNIPKKLVNSIIKRKLPKFQFFTKQEIL